MRHALYLLLTLTLTATAAQFEDVSKQSGIHYVGTAWSAAWRDFNSDGLTDLWTSNHGGRPSLYVNKGNGQFELNTSILKNGASRDGHAVVWGDLNNDGNADLVEVTGAVLGSGKGANQLFLNTGNELKNVAVDYGVSYPLGRGRVPLWLDYNNDGLLDLLIMNQSRADGKAPSTMFLNTKAGFQQVADAAGLFAIKKTANDAFVIQSNLSGKLPMELVVFGAFPPPFTPRVYKNVDGDYQEVTQGIIQTPISDVFDAVTADFNGDLQPDIFLSRYRYASVISPPSGNSFRASIFNNGAEVRGLDIHSEGNLKIGIHLPTVKWNSSMIFFGKDSLKKPVDKKEVISLYYTLDVNDSSLWNEPVIKEIRNRAIYVWYEPAIGVWKLRFTSQTWAFLQLEVALDKALNKVKAIGFKPQEALQPVLLLSSKNGYQKMPLPHLPSCTSAAAADFDNDGDVDIYMVCTLGVQNTPNILLLNSGSGEFALPKEHGAEGTEKGVGQKAAVADYDNDGFLDLFVINGLGPSSPITKGPYQLFNNLGNNNHWLKIKLEGTVSNRDAVGAKVVIATNTGKQMREQNGKSHYGAQDGIVLHFGIGNADVVDRVTVYWPSGITQVIESVEIDQALTIIEPTKNEKMWWVMSKNPSAGVLVTGAPRSGTSWVGRMLSIAPNAEYIHEPLNNRFVVEHFKEEPFPFWYMYLNIDNQDIFIDRITRMINLEPSPSTQTGEGTIQIIKDPIAVFSSEWLANTYDLDVVFMIRHPCAVIKSILSLGWNTKPKIFYRQQLLMDDYLSEYEQELKSYQDSNNTMAQAALVWKMIYHVAHIYQERNPHWVYIRHEDICKNPVETFREIFLATGLEYNINVADRIGSYSSSTNPVKPTDHWDIKRSSKDNVNTWSDYFTTQQLNEIRSIVEPISSYYYSDLEWLV